MSFKAAAWTVLAVVAFAAILLFNYWVAFQPSKYTGRFGKGAGTVGIAQPDSSIPLCCGPRR